MVIMLLHVWAAYSRHVAGGELYYYYLGAGNPTAAGKPTANYRITLRLFRDCASSGPQLESEQVTVGIYANSQLVKSVPLPLQPPEIGRAHV